MSKSESLTTIDLADLAHVNGGDDTHIQGRANGRIVSAEGDARYTRSNYETCLAYNRQQALDAYPDTRNLLDYVLFRPDRNGLRRANYERAGMGRCGAPPAGS
jgi:hypothetical protein